jgi:hypothetical protein
MFRACRRHKSRQSEVAETFFGKLTDKAILACVCQGGGAEGKEQGGEQLFVGLSV